MYFFLVEGQGRTLEEIDTMYIERVSPMKSSKWIAPSAQEMARIRKQAGTDETADINLGTNDVEHSASLSGATEAGEGDIRKSEERGTEHDEQVIR